MNNNNSNLNLASEIKSPTATTNVQSGEEVTFVKLKNKKPRSFLRRLLIGCLTGCGCLLLLVICALVLLAITKPEIEVDFVKTPAELKLPEKINASSEYPKLQFDNTYRLGFANGRSGLGTEYQTSAEDFQEGENIVNLQGYTDYIFIKFVAKEKKTATVQVDRIAPEVSLTKSPDKYLLLEDAKVEIKAKEELKYFLFTGDKDTEIKPKTAAEKDELGIYTLNFNFVPKNGDNSLEISARDAFGNSTKLSSIVFKAFSQSGYTLANCADLKFALNSALQLGMLNGQAGGKPTDKSNIDCEGTTTMIVARKGLTNPCGGPCDYNPFAISLKVYSKDMAATIKELTTGKTKNLEEEVTTSSGLKGKRVKTQFFNILDNQSVANEYVLFSNEGKTYVVATDSSADGVPKASRLNYFNEIWQNAKF